MLKLLSGQGFDIRRYNRPTADEIAVLIIENDANSGQDFIYEAWQRGESAVPEDSLIVSRVLSEIEDHLRQCEKYLTDFPDLPIIQHNLLNTDRQTQLFAEEMNFLQDELQRILKG
ncbi:5406_t:CDS:2, partial [Gigaspora rosea]